MSNIQLVSTMVKLCLAMVIGFVLNRRQILNEATTRGLSGLIVNVTCPALILYSVCKQTVISLDVLKLFGFGVMIYLLLPVVAWLLMRPFGFGKPENGIYQLLLIFANANFMGFPVVQAVYGEKAIFYMNILNIPFTLLMFTYGLRLIRSGRPQITGNRVRNLLSPGLLAGLLSLVIYFLQIPVPLVVADSLGFVGGVTTPLSMMVIGSILAGFSFREVFSDKNLWAVSVAKLVLLPLAGWLIAGWIFQDLMLVGIITISLGMPAASLCVMVCKQYGGKEKTAAIGVLITTVLSFFTIPVLILLLNR